jgi:asparagine synthase (glutamine-hydrolysing)
LLLDQWTREPARFVDRLNGAAAAIVLVPRENEVHVFTDRMGAFPVYRSSVDPLCLCSHPDVLADYLASKGSPPEFDLATLAECLATGAAVHPSTYYKTIRQLDAATHFVFSMSVPARDLEKTAYWPSTPAAEMTLSGAQLADDLANALRTAGKRRSASVLGLNGLLLSGGADSRALLYSAAEPQLVETLTFCDAANPEAAVAGQIAAVANSPHHLLFRSPEHYAHGALETVRITGGMFSIKDAHFHGFLPALQKLGLGNLMTGCYTDYLLKGLAYNKSPYRLFGRPLPIDRPTAFSMEYYQPFSAIRAEWRTQVDARLEEWFTSNARATYDSDPDQIADLRVRPLSREADAMGRLFMLRTLPWDPVMLDNEVLDMYLRIPKRLKLNARVFRAAVTKIVPPAARSIPNNNDFSPLDSPESVRVLRYVSRKIADRLFSSGSVGFADQLSTGGSWPNFVYFAKTSLELEKLWCDPTPGQRELLTDLLGEDPWRRSLAAWADFDIDLILRLITLKLWLGLRGV